MTDLVELIKLAKAVKAAVEEVHGDVEYNCHIAAAAICAIIPEAGFVQGRYDGEPHCYAVLDIDGELVVVDPTISQFAEAPEIFVGTITPEFEWESAYTQSMDGSAAAEHLDDDVMAKLDGRGWGVFA